MKNYNPPPVAFHQEQIRRLLTGVCDLEQAEDIVLSARLYALGMEFIEERPEIAYQLFISSIETLANRVFTDYEPDRASMIETKRPVLELARKLGIHTENAEALALSACQGEHWVSRKFCKFLSDYSNEDIWREDTLFPLPKEFIPKKEHFESTLKKIYRYRGKALHAGRPYPSSVSTGVQPGLDPRAIVEVGAGGPEIPPVTWFERVVNTSLRLYLERELRPGDC